MNKKVMIMLLALGLLVPVFAAEQAVVAAKADGRPALAEKQGEFLKAQKELRAKMKATDEKMEKLVKEYNKLKGKKQEAKKAEIVAEVAGIRQEQLKFKQEQLDKFAKRLEEMKKLLDEASTDEAKKAWVEEKTEELIKSDGDLKVLFERPKHDRKPGMHKKGPHRKGFFKGRKGPKGSRFGGPKDDDGRVGINPPPPPPAEEK